MELGSLEGRYLELLNSDADPLHLYHFYDQISLAAEEEIELCSGGLFSSVTFQVPPQCNRTASLQPREAQVSKQWSAPWTALPHPCQSACLSHLPHNPSPVSPASSKVLFLPEPYTDTINCDQFSRLLCDIEGDEETREAYANIGE